VVKVAASDSTTRARELRERLSIHLGDHDRGAAVRAALDAVEAGEVGVAELYREVLTPLLAETGDGWQRGSLRVWEEHLTSAAIRTIVEALYPTVLSINASRPACGRAVLLACPPEEGHDLGLRMVADRFEMAGWTTYFVGSDTPLDELADAARRLDVEAIALSSSTHFHRVAVRRHLERLRRDLPGVRVWLGGPAFRENREDFKDDLLDLDALLGDAGVPDEGEGRTC
jgi:methanogenic corrinoid protein MtbC1